MKYSIKAFNTETCTWDAISMKNINKYWSDGANKIKEFITKPGTEYFKGVGNYDFIKVVAR